MSRTHEAEEAYHENSLKSLRQEYDSIQRQLGVLLDLRIKESITQDEYDKKVSELKPRQHDIDVKLKEHTVADEDFRITVSHLLDLSARAYELFQGSKVDQKRQLINFVLSNLKLDGKKLVYKLKKPFDAMVLANERKLWLLGLDSNQ